MKPDGSADGRSRTRSDSSLQPEFADTVEKVMLEVVLVA